MGYQSSHIPRSKPGTPHWEPRHYYWRSQFVERSYNVSQFARRSMLWPFKLCRRYGLSVMEICLDVTELTKKQYESLKALKKNTTMWAWHNLLRSSTQFVLSDNVVKKFAAMRHVPRLKYRVHTVPFGGQKVHMALKYQTYHYSNIFLPTTGYRSPRDVRGNSLAGWATIMGALVYYIR